jgi:hypothetical protein
VKIGNRNDLIRYVITIAKLRLFHKNLCLWLTSQFSALAVIPANYHDLPVTTEDESAATESGDTDAFRPAGLIRAGLVLLYARRMPVQ